MLKKNHIKGNETAKIIISKQVSIFPFRHIDSQLPLVLTNVATVTNHLVSKITHSIFNSNTWIREMEFYLESYVVLMVVDVVGEHILVPGARGAHCLRLG